MSNMDNYKSNINTMTEDLNESTGASWLWAFLFGPIWFLFIGSWRYAAISLVLSLFVVGIIINPFLAYPAHRAVARDKAEKAYASGVKPQ